MLVCPCLPCLQAFLGAHYGFQQSLMSSRLRSAVTCVVFRKALTANAATLAAAGSGRVQVGPGSCPPACNARPQPLILDSNTSCVSLKALSTQMPHPASKAACTHRQHCYFMPPFLPACLPARPPICLQTLMSVDADRVVNLCLSLHELWSLPLQIAIALWLLYTQVQCAFLAGLALVLLLIPVNRALAVRIQAASIKMMAAKDRCVLV